MPANEYKPTSWNGEPINNAKLNQMCNNTQFLFERSPRIRYAAAGTPRDNGLRIISGKTPFPAVTTATWVAVPIYFGSFFAAGCRPVVTATLEGRPGWLRRRVTIHGISGEVDHNGFVGVISTEYDKALTVGGWIHWTAVGY